MRIMQNLLIILLLMASFPAFTQDRVEDADLAWSMKLWEELEKNESTSDVLDLERRWISTLMDRFDGKYIIPLGALNKLARLRHDNRDYKGAHRLFEKQFNISREMFGPEATETLAAKGWLAGNLRIMGRLEEAEEMELQLTTDRAKILGPEHSETLIAANNLAGIKMMRGNFADAKIIFEELVQVREKILGPDHPDTLVSMNNLASTLQRLGQVNDARQLLVEVAGRRSRVLGVDHLGTLSAKNNLALVLKEQGDLSGARKILEEIVESLTKTAGPDHLTTWTAIHNLSIMLNNQGEYSRAQQLAERVVEARTRILGPEHHETLISVACLASSFYAQGGLESAKKLEEYVVEVRSRTLGRKHPSTLLAISNLGVTLSALGELDRAQGFFKESLGEYLSTLGPTHSNTLGVEYNIATILILKGDLDRAQDILEKINRIHFDIHGQGMGNGNGLHRGAAKELAEIHRKRGEMELARSLYLSLVDEIEVEAAAIDYSEILRNAFRQRHEALFREVINIFLRQNWAEDAFHVLERYRGQDLLSLLRWKLARTSPEVAAELRTLARRHDELTAQIDHQIDPDPQLVAERDAVLRNIQVQRGMKIRELDDKERLKALNVDEIRQSLEDGTVMLSFSVAPQGGHVFILRKGKPLIIVPLDVTQQDLIVQTTKFSQLNLTVDKVRSPGLEDTVEIADATARLAAGRWLYDHLLAPASEHFQDAERLVIVPDHVLYYLPFAALVRPADNERGWEYLVEWKPIHTVQSGTVYVELLKRRPENERPRTLVALGDPSYPSSEDAADGIVRSATERGLFDGLDPLPNTRREVESIAQLFVEKDDEARVFLDTDATEENAKAALPGGRYVHFATHGLADPEQPRHSFLALTIPEGLPADRENGILQAWEIVDQLRLDADLVTLSACSTGFGPVQAGEGVMSLSRAFQVAGARTVMATLWPVADASTAELMIRFYDPLLNAGASKDEALREAQLAFIRSASEVYRIPVLGEKGGIELKDFSSPYYWAAFQLIGDWR